MSSVAARYDDGQIACDASGLPSECRDRRGTVAWRLQWREGALRHAWIRLPTGDHVELVPASDEHAVLGACDLLQATDGTPLARIASVDWAAPAAIPAVDVPGALAPGTGTAVLNLLAWLAARAGRTTLRYRGPYPTHALLASLGASFRVADPDAAADAFATAAASAAFGNGVCEPAVDFVPAPHVCSWTAPRVCAQLRDGVERLWVDGRPFDRSADHARLVDDGNGLVARVVFAGTSWCDVVIVDATGEPLVAIASPPRAPADLVGFELPVTSAQVLAHTVAEMAVAPLRAEVAAVIAPGLRLSDLGLDPARLVDGRIEIHAELAARALALDPATSLGTLAAAIGPVAVRAAASALARRWNATVATGR